MKSLLLISALFLGIASEQTIFAQNTAEKTITPYETIYSDERGTVKMRFLLFPCKNDLSFRRYGFYNTIADKGNFLEGKFDYVECDGKTNTQRFYVNLGKTGEIMDSGDWFGSRPYKIIRVYDVKPMRGRSNSSSNQSTGNYQNEQSLLAAEKERTRQQELALQREREQREAEERRRKEQAAYEADLNYQRQVNEVSDPVARKSYENYRQLANSIKDPDERRKFLEEKGRLAASSQQRSQTIEQTGNLVADLLTSEVDALKDATEFMTISGGISWLQSPYFRSNATSLLKMPELNFWGAFDVINCNGLALGIDFTSLNMRESNFTLNAYTTDGRYTSFTGEMLAKAYTLRMGVGYNLSLFKNYFHLTAMPTIGMMDINEHGWTYANKKYEIDALKNASTVWTYGFAIKSYLFLGNRLAVTGSYNLCSPFNNHGEEDLYQFKGYSNVQIGLALRIN